MPLLDPCPAAGEASGWRSRRRAPVMVQRNDQHILLQAVILAAGSQPAPWLDAIGVPGLEMCSGREFGCGTSRGTRLCHVSSQAACRDRGAVAAVLSLWWVILHEETQRWLLGFTVQPGNSWLF